YAEPTKCRRLEAKGYNEDNSEMENVNNNPSLIGININITEEGVLLSKEDFKLLVQKISNIELTIENNQKQIESLIETADICLTVQNDSRKS
ncbi:22451_t:CDS:1, partial [Entrophospora sp. SA101]